MSKISVIIPVYNHIKALTRSLQSLRLQTVQPSEVIVVDDGSTDGDVSEVIKKTALSCRIIFVQQKNLGASSARNTGFKVATREFVIFWDADTVARPEMLDKLLKALQAHPEASYVYSKFKFGWKTMQSGPYDSERLRKLNYIDSTALVRRSDFCCWDENLQRLQDWDVWLTMLEKGKKGVFISELLYTKITSVRRGISEWLPSFFYTFPWSLSRRRGEYEVSRKIIIAKHPGLTFFDL